MSYHIRFTPHDISGYTFDFLDKYNKYILAFEEKDKVGEETTPHYHIYVEQDNVSDQTIRLACKISLKIPKSGRGQSNKYYAIVKDWKDPGYICKENDIKQSKGFTEKQIMEFVISGKKRYLSKVDGTELSGEVAPADRPKRHETTRITNKDMIGESIIQYHCMIRDLKEKNEYDESDIYREELAKIIMNVLRANGKGVNEYQVRDFAHAVLYETDETKNYVVKKISRLI